MIKQINRFLSGNKSVFDYNLEKQMAYLNKMPEPQSLIQRAYFQYKCQTYQRSSIINFRNNLFAFLSLFPILLYVFIKPKHQYKVAQIKSDKRGAVFIYAGVDDIVPQSLKKKYKHFHEIDFGKASYLKITDVKYIKQLFYYLHSPYFLLKSVYKMAMYRAIIDDFNPEAIICSSEYSFTSSLLTWYCEQNQLQHINVMHGEKLLNIRDSFFQFHECCVWDKHYVDLFKQLRAVEKQFIIDTPPSLFLKNTALKPEFELTYYLGDENSDEMERINEVLYKINIPNVKICIRPHPRYTDLNQVAKVFTQFAIENTREVKIEQSINNARIIASLYSTVLYQGFISGKQIVLDDLTQVDKFKKLKLLKFIIFSKDYKTISSLI